jgi:hypothetical protein
MDTSKEAIELLLTTGRKSAEPIEREYAGRKYINKELTPITEPLTKALRISTLSSLIELCSGKFGKDSNDTIAELSGFERFDPKAHVIHVVSEKQVQVVTALSNVWKDREVLIDCQLTETQGFPFGKFLKQDEFIIGLLSAFVPSAHRDQLAKLAGNATAEAVTTAEDDGVSQVMGVRSGAHLKDTTQVKNIVSLRFYRTFREVDQPISDFLFRLRQSGENIPEFALFEADGGTWKLEALENIARKLSAGLTEATVVS